MSRVRVKVCCIASEAEAELAIRHGVHAVGLVSEMPSGPGMIPEEDIARITSLSSQVKQEEMSSWSCCF